MRTTFLSSYFVVGNASFVQTLQTGPEWNSVHGN